MVLAYFRRPRPPRLTASSSGEIKEFARRLFAGKFRDLERLLEDH